MLTFNKQGLCGVVGHFQLKADLKCDRHHDQGVQSKKGKEPRESVREVRQESYM